MPITPFLNGERFDPESRRVLGIAFELTCIALRTGDCADDVKQAIADIIIAVAKTGERNPDVLCEKALRDIRGSNWSPSPSMLVSSSEKGTGGDECQSH
jgi:hypothetical protein